MSMPIAVLRMVLLAGGREGHISIFALQQEAQGELIER